MSRLELVAESHAQESGFLALADFASLTKEAGIEYRVVGGLMVTLHLAVSGAFGSASTFGRQSGELGSHADLQERAS